MLCQMMCCNVMLSAGDAPLSLSSYQPSLLGPAKLNMVRLLDVMSNDTLSVMLHVVVSSGSGNAPLLLSSYQPLRLGPAKLSMVRLLECYM